MCNCENIEIASQGNQTLLDIPPHITVPTFRDTKKEKVYVDVCISEEIKSLWDRGITTTGCCCGHNKIEGFIGVIDEDIPRMKELGYEVHFNKCRPDDEDSFIPKLETKGEK
jgi:hypothetical protein